MRIFSFLSLLVLTSLLGCHPFYLNNNDLSKVSKNIDYKQLEKTIGNEPEDIFKLSYKGKKYEIVVYSYLTDITRTSSSYSSSSGWSTTNLYKLKKYTFLIRNDSLVYWGLPTEFSKSGVDEFEVLTDTLRNVTKDLPNNSFTSVW